MNSDRHFVIPGEVKGKARPRFTRTGHAYTPKGTTTYESWVKLCYLQEHRDKPIYTGAIAAAVQVYVRIPKSASRKKRLDMIEGRIKPQKKPDVDNILKIIFDSLNKIAYDDDKQIYKVVLEKRYTEDEPRVEVILSGDES